MLAPKFDMSFLTRQPDFTQLEGQQQQAWDEAYRPGGPQMQPAISKKDIPFLLLGTLGALALGANKRDIGEGFQGFMGARQNMAETDFQNAQREDMWRRKNAEMKANRIGDQIERQRKDFEYRRGQMDEQRRDTRNFEQQKQINQMGIDARAAIQKEKGELARNTDLLKMGPQGRYQWALANGYSEEAAQFAAYLPTEQAQVASAGLSNAKTQTENEMRAGRVEGQDLKNEYQRIVNEYLPKQLQGKITLTDKQAAFLDEKIKYYPLYLQATIARAEIARALAGSQIYDRSFNQSMDVWKAQNQPKIDMLQKELDSHLKELKEIENGDAMQQTLNIGRKTQLQTRIDQIKERLDQLSSVGLPSAGGFQALPAVEGAPPLGGIDITVPFATGPIGNKGTGTRPQTVAPKTRKSPTGTPQGPNSTEAKAAAARKKYDK